MLNVCIRFLVCDCESCMQQCIKGGSPCRKFFPCAHHSGPIQTFKKRNIELIGCTYIQFVHMHNVRIHTIPNMFVYIRGGHGGCALGAERRHY